MIKERKTIQSLERGFALLEILSLSAQPLSLGEISRQVQLGKTTVHGLLSTLCHLGYAQKNELGYALGVRLRELSKPLEQHDEMLKRHFMPLIKQMAMLTNNTAYLAIQSGAQEYLYIDAIEQENPLTLRNPRGRREGLTTSAIGKVFLAENPQLRRQVRKNTPISSDFEAELNQVIQQGFALDLEQAEAELNCLAIPLFIDGQFVAVAGVSGHAQDLTQHRLIDFAKQFLSVR
ncbi:helix-turn-helix domain-containing protein [Vibrio sp. SM6]|uniref:Helix-turn-helix domain-containing protein n=1 Tax=Vibrio agarilyticus TaxID=2726741 RepID=A0A7X8YHX0_9VIBR|nr:helix-turn-helix domain-containing protein [Vibrio agarilyticus]NLS13792.1 helix-turn-helix domain-containing protein [Vibrio agarilyticus]